MSDVCDDGIVEVTLCNGVRSVVLNGGFTFNAYAFDAETRKRAVHPLMRVSRRGSSG